MNIKQHIEAGHYPKDEKGRALVPMGSGRTAIIYCTDHPPKGTNYSCIIGRDPSASIRAWDCHGQNEGYHTDNLLPPPPRKREVKRYLVVGPGYERGPYTERIDAECVTRSSHPSGRIVELTGSYEQEW